jgi:acyl dehydratase
MIKQGDIYEHAFSYSQDEVAKFAEVTGDNNPVHLDAEYAAKTMFKKPIMHGFLGGSVFSKVFGTLFPGEGTIYMKQDMKFLRPMYVDTQYKAVFEVTSANHEKHRAVIKTQVIDAATGDVTIEGEAMLMNVNKI